MEKDAAEKFFDQKCASGYDQLQTKLASLRDALHFLLQSILAPLPSDARVLCVGAGTGSELLVLAEAFPEWQFTAVEPSAPMLEVCQQKAENSGIAARCEFHHGYVDTLPVTREFDAATSLLVSQFVLDPDLRIDFFREIGRRLKPGGRLVSADLAADTGSAGYQSMLEIWWRSMKSADVSPEGFDRMKSAYGRDVAVLEPDRVAAIIASAGFETPEQFLQTGLIHAWFTSLEVTQAT